MNRLPLLICPLLFGFVFGFPDAQGDLIYKPHPNELLEDRLGGNRLQYTKVSKGMALGPNTLLATLPNHDANELPLVIVSFKKKQLIGSFLEEILDATKMGHLAQYPFDFPNIQLVVASSKVYLILKDGVLFNIRSAYSADSSRKPFIVSNALGEVVFVRGQVLASFEHEIISKRLGDFSVIGWWSSGVRSVFDDAVILEDGAFVDPRQIDWPAKYPPVSVTDHEWDAFMSILDNPR